MPEVSVIIPTYNRLGRLRSVVSALECQVLTACFEVIIVSDGSTDGSNQFLKTYSQPLEIKALFQNNQGPAAARNLGIAHAKGDIILFLDDDVVPIPNFIQEHLKAHAETGYEGVILGPMLTPLDMKLSPWGKWEQEMLMKQYAAMQKGEWQPTGRQFYTGNSSLARRYLLESGGFDTTLRRAEDIELAYRLEANGLRFHFHPDAIGYHYVKRSYQSWVQIAYDYGVNDVTFHKVKKHEWLLPNLFKEFQTRNYGIKGLTWLCLDHPSLSNLITRILRTMIIGKQHLSFEQLYMALCSVIFNLRYYQGVADALGGREIFFEVLSSSKTK